VNRRTAQKAETRRRILAAASRLFRSQGFAATGVDAVMAEAGLTAGGFYSHFKSKNDLLGECLKAAFEDSRGRLTKGLEGDPKRKARGMLARYLSTQHRDEAESGCPLVGIAAELGRHAKHTSKVTAAYLTRLISSLEELGYPRRAAIAAVSSAVGALLLARLVRGESISDEILSAVKDTEIT
jgi:TetR/AcrR family transcriptional repressor of nem operon